MTAQELRALARIARGDARRSLARSVLIAALVALPVAGLVVGLVLVRTTTPTAEDLADAEMGAADLVVETAVVSLGPLLPPGSRLVGETRTSAGLVLAGRRPTVQVSDLPLDDPVAEGLVALTSGRVPERPGEAAVSRALLDLAGAEVGDMLALEDPDLDVLVTGVTVHPQDLRRQEVTVAPGTLVGLADPPSTFHRTLVDLAGADPESVAAGLQHDQSFYVLTRQPLFPRQAPVSIVFVLGALALFEAALMAGAAFAVGARRQLRTLGLLAATGGERRHLAGTVVMSGVVLGGVGALAGVVLGLGVTLALAPSLDRMTGRIIEGLTIRPLELAAAALLGAAAAVAAAWLPARSAARVPPSAALAGRRPLTRPRRITTLLGLLAVGAGCAMTALGTNEAQPTLRDLLIVGGAIAVVGGFAACSSALVGTLGRLAPRLPTSLRLAVRDAARHRTRVGPAVAAVMAALSMPVALSAYLLTTEAEARAGYVPSLDEDQLLLGSLDGDVDAAAGLQATSEEVAALVPGTVASRMATATVDQGEVIVTGPDRSEEATMTAWTLAVGDADLLDALGASAARADFEAGAVVGLGSDTVEGGRVHLDVDSAFDARDRSLVLPAVAVDVPSRQSLPTYLMGEEAAAGLGLTTGADSSWLLRLPAPVDDQTLARAQELAAQRDLFVSVEQPFITSDAALRQVALGLSAIIALSVVAIAAALSAAESRHDLATLTAVGADPRTRRRLRATQAGSLAFLGGILAVPAGLLPAVTVLAARDVTEHLTLPWAAMGAATVAVPLVAALATGLLSRAPKTALTRRPA